MEIVSDYIYDRGSFSFLSVLYCCLLIGIASCNVAFDGKINLVTASCPIWGVRQRGVLSPCLFAIYVDDLISLLRLSRYGLYT